jgi:hypothetical protein
LKVDSIACASIAWAMSVSFTRATVARPLLAAAKPNMAPATTSAMPSANTARILLRMLPLIHLIGRTCRKTPTAVAR